ncbi:MAG: hypothetical protein GY918_14910 [Gammaproteobacteria bacterium]|nr:hypothetical protein [Gammaproteobacteria bacterium]
MDRFTRTQILDHVQTVTLNNVTAAFDSALPSGAGLTMSQMRAGITSGMGIALEGLAEAFRHLYEVSSAEAAIFQLNGDVADGQYQMTLLANGEVGGLIVPDPQGGPDIETGYQLMPIVTGAPVTSGVISPSDPFDGVSEIDVGDIPNTLKIRHDGQITISASCLPEVDGGQNRQIECDIAVFDESGDTIDIIGFRTSVNNSTGGRGNSATVPTFTIQGNTIIPPGSNIGLVIRKNETPGTVVDVVINRSFILASYSSLAET